MVSGTKDRKVVVSFLNDAAGAGIMKITDVLTIQLHLAEEISLPAGPGACLVGARADPGGAAIASVMVSSPEFRPRFVRSVSGTRRVPERGGEVQTGLAVAPTSR